MTTKRARFRRNASRYLSIPLILFFSLGCRGGVKHPPPGEENDEKYCANRPDYENNCMACSALPGCGWCDEPKSGKAQCQPGTEHEGSKGCEAGWALSSEDCETPPPPPPPPPQ